MDGKKVKRVNPVVMAIIYIMCIFLAILSIMPFWIMIVKLDKEPKRRSVCLVTDEEHPLSAASLALLEVIKGMASQWIHSDENSNL